MSSSPARIAFCITDLDPGGAERAMLQLVTRLDRARWEPAVFCLSKRGLLADDLERAGIPVTCYGANWAWQAPRVVSQLRRALQDWKPQLLQTFLFHANFLGRIAGWSAGVPCIVSGIRVAERRSKTHLRLDRWTDHWVRKHVAVSQSVADFSIREAGLPLDKVVVIHNGVDVEFYANAPSIRPVELGLPESARLVVTVGRLDPQKGLLDLVAAAEPILREIGDVQFLFVGEGPQRGILEQEIKSRGLSGRIHLPGWRADIPQLLKSAELFVLPSLWEGLPNAVMEAMASGLPVICTRVEGASELIETERSGLLVDPANPAALSQALFRLLNDKNLEKSLGNSAQQRVREHFSWDRMAAAYDDLYQGLLQRS